ncbi:MAG: hypothetical protein MJ114_05150 [Acetatifactor sp.]|nr:hypothetical protein [Acetatifactor sp.]
MVLEDIYYEYKQRVLSDLEESLSDEEVEILLEDGTVHDMILKRLAKALTAVIFRNGKIEDIHAGECEGEPDFKGIPDSCMKEVNIDVCNKMYSMLTLLFSENDDDFKRAMLSVNFGELCTLGWYDPTIDRDICFDLKGLL